MSATAVLKPNRDKPVRHGHPWIFSGAVARWENAPATPGVVDVRSAAGEWLGRGLGHPSLNLAVRLLTRREDEAVDDAFFAARLDRALALREQCFGPFASDLDTDAYRLVCSEADGLSGLIIDRYADVLSIRVGAAAWLPWLPLIRGRLAARTGIHRVFIAAESDAVEREGLSADAVAAESRDPPAFVRIRESNFLYDVDVAGGQKTGFYLDQRESRKRVAAYAAGREVLSAYCYTGSFELHAAAAGAKSIIGLDASAPALERARAHHALNGLAVPVDYRVADVPVALRRFRDEARAFDLVVLDPPRFVSNPNQLEKGLRAYKDINLLALKLLRPGGILATFSCSGWVKADQLHLALGWAATDAHREVQILETLAQPADHPVLLTFPEGAYLHGLIARAV
ncbi:MAG TPA: class I SAM-dependent rRNA methyltransferase [Kiritimatiellia bacterium]|nr:class I SAM-dependent rRNA methyltransferase [Kiritimatiellia bacterium]